MKSSSRRRLLIVLPLATYAIFMWRSLYGAMQPVLGIIDWALVIFGLGLWIGARIRRRTPWPSIAPLDLPLLAWLVVTVITAFFSVNIPISLETVWLTLTNILILYLLVDAVRRGWASALMRALYLLASISFLLSVLEIIAWYIGLPLLPNIQEGWLSIGGLNDPFPPVLHRVMYAMLNATTLSGFVALLIPPAFCTILATRNREKRIGLLVWLGAAVVTLFLTLSRNGFLAIGASLLFIALGSLLSPQFRNWWRRHSVVNRALIIAAIAVTTALMMVLGLFLATRLAQHQSGDTVRLDLWRSAIEMFLDRPVTGVGPGAYGTALRFYRNPLLARDQIPKPHNIYLEVGAERGIPGLIIGIWILLALLWIWWRRWRSQSPGTYAWWRTLGIGASLLGLGARSLVEAFIDSAIILPTLLLVALLLTSPPHRTRNRSMRWKWTASAIALGLSALLLTWNSWGIVNFSRSLNATEENEIDAALSAANRAQQIAPWVPLYACHAGYLHGRQAAEGDQEAISLALDQYQICFQEMPAGWVDQLNRATMLWQAGRHTDARVAVQKATAENPLKWLLWLNRGHWAEMSGDREDAVRSYSWALVWNRELASSPFWEQGARPEMWEDIVAAGIDTLESQGKSEASQNYWRWQVTGNQGNWTIVIPQIEEWLSRHPDDVEAIALMGEALLGLNRSQEAFPWLERAVSADRSRAYNYVLRGEAALALGYYEEAENDFRTALFLEPLYRAHLGLARYYRAVGQIDEALSEFAQALPHPINTHSYDLVLYHQPGWTLPLPQVTHIAPRYNGEAALEWGALLEQEGDPEMAQRVYADALEIDPHWQGIQNRIDN